MQKDDMSYFRSRAAQERIAARASPNASAREVHDQRADMYSFRVAILAGNVGMRARTRNDERHAEPVQ